MERRVEVCSLAQLDAVIADLSVQGGLPAVVVSTPRIVDLFESGPLLQRLRTLITDSSNRWSLDPDSAAALKQATEFYQTLDLLDLQLDLMRMDLEEGVSMKNIRFDGVRRTANEVVANARNSAFQILDSITIEAQRIARMANLLGFGDSGVEVIKLSEDDLDWWFADVGGEEEFIRICGKKEESVTDGVTAGREKELIICAKEEKESVKTISAADLNAAVDLLHVQEDAAAVGMLQKDVQEDDGLPGLHVDEKVKEHITVSHLLRKIRALSQLLCSIKRGPFTA